MSKITKLSIRGVRAFGTGEPEVIKFEVPLTLIVGLNGSGKTTIIECLRYATTGELPPNSAQGGAWIHDPNLLGEREVLARVQLEFIAASGSKMTATRTIQCAIKKSQRTQKTLECSLVQRRVGERTAISSRTAEIDAIMPQYMGVSKAILENVIFCHQDESLWPISAPAVLKKKFDEIFEAQKYTKAIDNIKSLRKKKREDLEKLKLLKDHARQTKDRGVKSEQEQTKLLEEIESLKVVISEYTEKLKTAQNKFEEASDHAARFDSIVNSLTSKRVLRKNEEKNVASLRQHMDEMIESDEELQTMDDEYELQVEALNRDNEKLRKQYQSLALELDTARKTLGNKQSDLGKLNAQKEHFETQLERRQDLIRSAASRHNIRGFDGDVSEDQVRDFLHRLERAMRDGKSAAERSRKEIQEESQKSQQELSSLTGQQSALVQRKDSARSQIDNNDKKISTVQTLLDNIDTDEGRRAVLETSFKDTEQTLRVNKQQFEEAQYDQQIEERELNAGSFGEKKSRLEAELMQATKRVGDSARLELIRKDLKARKQMLETNLGAHKVKLDRAIGDSWQPSNIEATFQTAQKERATAVKDAEIQRDGVSRELEQINFRLNTVNKDLAKMKRELKDSESEINTCLQDDPSEYELQVRQAERELEDIKLDNQGHEALIDFYQQALSALSKDDCCRLCYRGMRTDKERRDLKKRIDDTLTKAAGQKNEEALRSAEQWLNDLKALRPAYDTMIRVKTEMPTLETEARALENKRENCNTRLESFDQQVKDLEGQRKDVDAFTKTVQTIARCHVEISEFEKNIQDLEATQKSADQSRGLELIQEELKKVSEQVESTNKILKQLRDGRERGRARLNELELQVRDLKAQLTNADHQLREKTTLEAQIQDLKKQSQDHKQNIVTANKQAETLVPQISQAEAKYLDITQRGEERLKEHQDGINKLNHSMQQIRSVEEDINTYLDRGGKELLTRASRDMQNLQADITRVETEQRKVTVEVNEIGKKMNNHEKTKRAIQDNLRFRESRRQLENLIAEIAELESHNAEADRAQYEREASKWQKERNQLSSDQSGLLGQVRAKDQALLKLMEDWTTEYKDAAYKYKEAHIRVETTSAAVEDLGRYGNALDQAIMKYHSLKMEQINSIIEELWRKTYQGTDVDKIEIKSENETTKGNKSYNYRVVMRKQDTEMDMRGRCSAGQKVLASIIIRLALAECFGVQCGLIALDEPTTNLDRDNIRALAEALAEIIRIRRQQSNFQIIIITHDEDFLRQMNCSDFCDFYYRVSRNAEQQSQILQQSVAEVM